MNVEAYLIALDAKFHALEGFISAVSIHREVDANLNVGFIKGNITFLDGSLLEFSEQLPPERRRYRLHYMDGENNLIVRWDSAPHHKEFSTFPYHKHTAHAAEAHGPISLLEALDEIVTLMHV
jgi:hypothetical protein